MSSYSSLQAVSSHGLFKASSNTEFYESRTQSADRTRRKRESSFLVSAFAVRRLAEKNLPQQNSQEFFSAREFSRILLQMREHHFCRSPERESHRIAGPCGRSTYFDNKRRREPTPRQDLPVICVRRRTCEQLSSHQAFGFQRDATP